MKRARRFVYLSLYCMLIVTCFSIGIFCLSSRTINSYYEIYYTYTPSTLSKRLIKQYLTENSTVTEVYFDAFDNEERTRFTTDETTYQTSDCILLGDTSENDDESVLAYTNSQKTQMYILCTEKITFPVNCEGLFRDYSSLTTIQFNNVNTKNVTNMRAMFRGCASLIDVDVSKFDTGNVTAMGEMFFGCESLTSLDLSSFDTQKVRSMSGMFQECKKLQTLDISSFDTSMVTIMSAMFFECHSLEELDLSHFNTSRVTTIYYMFRNCHSLTKLDVSNFDTSSVGTGDGLAKTGFNCMFYGCSSLTSLDLSSFNTKNVTTMSMMFLGCGKLTSLNISSFNTSNVISMAAMFHGSGFTTLDLSHFNTSNVIDMHQMFFGCKNLVSLDISSFDTSKVTKMAYMFRRGSFTNLTNIYIGKGWTTKSLLKTEFETLSFGDAIGDTGMFMGCTSLPNFNSSYTGKTYAHAGEGGYLTYKSEE